jgi:hypothetical protein
MDSLLSGVVEKGWGASSEGFLKIWFLRRASISTAEVGNSPPSSLADVDVMRLSFLTGWFGE